MNNKFTKKEFMKITESSRYTVEEYVKRGIISPEPGKGGHYVYSENDVIRMNLTKKLKVFGMTLEDIRIHLNENNPITSDELKKNYGKRYKDGIVAWFLRDLIKKLDGDGVVEFPLSEVDNIVSSFINQSNMSEPKLVKMLNGSEDYLDEVIFIDHNLDEYEGANLSQIRTIKPSPKKTTEKYDFIIAMMVTSLMVCVGAFLGDLLYVVAGLLLATTIYKSKWKSYITKKSFIDIFAFDSFILLLLLGSSLIVAINYLTNMAVG